MVFIENLIEGIVSQIKTEEKIINREIETKPKEDAEKLKRFGSFAIVGWHSEHPEIVRDN